MKQGEPRKSEENGEIETKGFIRRPRTKQERNQSKWRSEHTKGNRQNDEIGFVKAMELAETAVLLQMDRLNYHLQILKFQIADARKRVLN